MLVNLMIVVGVYGKVDKQAFTVALIEEVEPDRAVDRRRLDLKVRAK